MTLNYGLLDLTVAESPVLETHVPQLRPAEQNHVVLVDWVSHRLAVVAYYELQLTLAVSLVAM